MPKTRAHVIFKGRVQGVYFRSFTRDAAQGLGLAGWVRNLYDGSVEAVVEGERESIDVLLAQCRTGPPYARVDDIVTEWTAYRDEFKSFSIR